MLPSGLCVYCFIFLEARSLKSRCQQGHAISESPKEGSSLIFQLLVGAGIIGVPWFGCPMGSHVLLLCVHLCLHFPLFIRILVLGLKVKVKSLSRVRLCDPMNSSPPGSSIHGILQSNNTGVGCHFILQGIFLTQGLNPGLPHCKQTLYRLSHTLIQYTVILTWLYLQRPLSR